MKSFVEVEVESGDFDGLADQLDHYAEAFDRHLQEGLASVVDMLLQYLYDLTPKMTRETASSWTVIPGDYGEWIISNSNEPIITYLTEGTEPHWVEPVVAKALHWIDPATGEDRFSMGHEVAGIYGVDIEGTALDAIDPFLEDVVETADELAAREAFGT